MQTNEDTPTHAAQRLIQSRYGHHSKRQVAAQDAAQHNDQAGEQPAADQDTTDDARASDRIIQRYSRTQKKD